MKKLFLVLAVCGGVFPCLVFFFIQHFSNEGFDFSGFVTAPFANPVAGGFTIDLLFTSGVFWVFMFRERSRGRGPRPFFFILLNCLIGLSCALPAYLYAREREGLQGGV